MPVTNSGYARPVSTVMTTVIASAVQEHAPHQLTPSAVTIRSMSLIAMNGTIAPPTP